MADDGKNADGYDELAETLAADPTASPDLRVLVGWVGRSDRDNHIRLYTTLDFGEHLDLPRSDVAHVHHSHDPLQPSLLWIRAGAKITISRSEARDAQATFLRGSLAASLGSAWRPWRPWRPWGPGGGWDLVSVPPQVSVCITCPTGGGDHTCVPATCTLASSCLTTVPTDPGCS